MPAKPFDWDNFEVGEPFDPYTVTVTQEMVDKHIEGLDYYLPWFSETAPFGRPIAPPTVIDRAMAQGMYGAAFAAPVERGGQSLHARQITEFLAPLYVDETYSISGKVSHKFERRGKRYAGVEGVAVDSSGKPVQRGNYIRLTAMVPGQTREGRDPEATAGEEQIVPGPGGPPSPRWEVGHEIAPMAKIPSVGKSIAYVGGDMGFHTNYEAAKKLGFKKPILMGLMSHAYFSELMMNFFGKSWVTKGKLSAAFIATIPVDEFLLVRGVIRGREPAAAGFKWDLELWIENKDGKKMSVGTASCEA